jgi:hypothetical protein
MVKYYGSNFKKMVTSNLEAKFMQVYQKHYFDLALNFVY